MGLLDSLAMGLRSAGGIMDEGVYKRQGQEEQVAQQLQNQQRALMAQQVIKGAESGAIPPEVAKQTLGKLFPGMEVPVGPDAQTQQRQEEVKRRQAIAQSFAQLAPEDRGNPLRIAEVFMQNGDHERGAQYINAAETRQARQEALIANLEQRRMEAERRSEDAALNREQRAEMARQANELRATIAQGQQALQRDSLELRRVLASQRQEPAPTVTEIADPKDPTKAVKIDARTGRVIGAAPPKPANEKSLPKGAIDSLTEVGGTAADFTRLATSFQDSFGGKMAGAVGDAQNLAGRNMPGSGYAQQAQWWQEYQDKKNIMRNKLFGSALTATEKAEFDKAQINPGMTAEAIKANLGRQKTAAETAARKLATAYAKGGYNKEQIEAALGIPLDALPTNSSAPPPPPGFKVN